jgi:hypothetical protein
VKGGVVMRTYLWIAIIFVTATIGLFWAFGAGVRTIFEIALVVFGLVPAVVRATPRLYVAWTRARFWAANVPATWDVNVRFQRFAQGSTIETLARYIQHRSAEVTLLARNDARIVLRTRRFVVELSGPSGTAESLPLEDELSISVAPITVGYRDSTRFLEHDLLPLMESCRDHVGARWASYSLRVDLPERNPYVGVYLQSIPVAPLQEFRIQFALPTAKDTKIVVGRERLTVISDTLEQFRKAVGAALAFRVPEG